MINDSKPHTCLFDCVETRSKLVNKTFLPNVVYNKQSSEQCLHLYHHHSSYHLLQRAEMSHVPCLQPISSLSTQPSTPKLPYTLFLSSLYSNFFAHIKETLTLYLFLMEEFITSPHLSFTTYSQQTPKTLKSETQQLSLHI